MTTRGVEHWFWFWWCLPPFTLLYVNQHICNYENEIVFVCIIWVHFKALSCWNKMPHGIEGGPGIITLNQKAQLTWRRNSPWHSILKFMVHSIHLFLERLHVMWFHPLWEKYCFCVRSLQDAFYYLYLCYNLIETYFSVSSQIRIAVTWFYELIYFQWSYAFRAFLREKSYLCGIPASIFYIHDYWTKASKEQPNKWVLKI